MSRAGSKIIVRNTRPEDFGGIAELSRAVYADSPAWSETMLSSHLEVFPEGQFVAIEIETGRVLGMAASLIILWDDYDMNMDWTAFTDGGFFTNHDLEHGRTLYGAEVMVEPTRQRSGVGESSIARAASWSKSSGSCASGLGRAFEDTTATPID